jgi:gluconolactonase
MITPILIATLGLAQAAPAKDGAPPAPVAPVATGRSLAASASPAADAQGKPGIPTLVAPDARPDLILKDLVFAEGPAADAAGNMYFCDFSSGSVWRVTRGARGFEARPIITESNGCVGLEFAPTGRLYATQFHTGRILELVLTEDGPAGMRVVVDTYEGESRPGVNDLAMARDGGIWFTNTGDPRRVQRRGVYYSTTSGAVPVQHKGPIKRPNGIALSPDGSTLYVVDAGAPVVWSFQVLGPGQLGEARTFADLAVVGDPAKVKGGDGVAVDVQGNLWVAVPLASAVVVFDPQGQPLGRIMLPEYPSNCAFGGADGRTLFITARTGVYALPTLVEGLWAAKGGAPTVFVSPSEAAAAVPALPTDIPPPPPPMTEIRTIGAPAGASPAAPAQPK